MDYSWEEAYEEEFAIHDTYYYDDDSNEENRSDYDYDEESDCCVESLGIKKKKENRKKIKLSSFVSFLKIQYPYSCYEDNEYKWKFSLDFLRSIMPDQALLGFLKGSFVDQDISNNKTPRCHAFCNSPTLLYYIILYIY